MPPYSYPSFEEIEAKEWANNTVSTILTDISPVSFECDLSQYDSNKTELLPTDKFSSNSNRISHHFCRNNNNNSNVRRSFSFLEDALSSVDGQKLSVNKSRRSQSTLLPNTNTSISTTTRKTQSAPTTPITQLSPHNSFSSRIRRQSVVKNLFQLNNSERKKSNKEQKGLTIWKDLYAEYLIRTPRSLEFESKSDTKRSILLSRFIMSELLATEETYLDHLSIIKNLYMDPLLDAATSLPKSSLVSLKEVETIFAFIPQLVTLSSRFVDRLQDTIESGDGDYTYIGKTFCDLAEDFDIYIAYAVNFSKSRKCLAKASSSIVYRQLVQDTIGKKKTNRMLLSDYMIAPIQRITRYCLLLKDLMKHSNKSHPDYVYLDKTLKSLTALAYAMNTVQC